MVIIGYNRLDVDTEYFCSGDPSEFAAGDLAGLESMIERMECGLDVSTSAQMSMCVLKFPSSQKL